MLSKRMTSSLKFYCRASKQNKEGYSPLEVSIVLNGQRKFYNLPQKFRPTDKKGIKEASSVWYSKINDIMMDMVYANIPLTSQNVRNALKNGICFNTTIKDLFEGYLSILKKRVGVSLCKDVYRKYELVYERLLTYVGKDDDVSVLTNGLVLRIYADLDARYDKSTSGGMMTRLKTFVIYGMDNGLLKTNPFNGFKINKGRKPITYLTEGEIEALRGLKLTNKSLSNVLDSFLVMAATGLSYVDLKNLKREDIKEMDGVLYINKRRQKTYTEFMAVVLPFGRPILEKGFKVITNQKLNAYLKTIGDMAGLNKNLTCHLARRTYATLLLNKGISLSTVAKAIGHTDTRITSSYYAELFKETVIKEIEKAF